MTTTMRNILKKLGNKIFSLLQQTGGSLMMPVSVLPAAGLLVALGRILQDSAESGGVVTNQAMHLVGNIFFSGGLAIFEQLPLVFAVGVAIGFTSGAGVAGLASVVGYFTFTNVLKVISESRALELEINTGVFGGILVGMLSAALYKRFSKTVLHPVLGFFSGKRLVPIVTACSSVFLAIGLGLIWPPIQEAINSFGTSIMDSDLGPAFYAAGKRLLIPVGLHHVYYPPFLYEFGDFVSQSGKVLHGESVRYFAGDPTAGKFMAAEFPVLLFGLPAACLAMYLRAPLARRKAVGGIMLSAALTSIITGITEPIEFAFIFVAPLLYVFHVLAAFASGLMTNYFDIHLGYTFSPSLIDFTLGYFNQKNSMYLWLVCGPAIFFLYFIGFYKLIDLFDYKTPGRDIDAGGFEEKMATIGEKAVAVLSALGGKENIEHLNACITRLRVTVINPKAVNESKLKELGAAGIMSTGNNLQVIFGTESDRLKEEIKCIMEGKAPMEFEKLVEEKTTNSKATLGKTLNLSSPLKGTIVDLKDVPDETFAQKFLGDGVAIKPDEGILYAPVQGKIVQLFHTNHALGIVTECGCELLLHIGLDTVKMEGEGFKAFVKVGDSVKAGDKLIEFDLDLIREKAKSDITPIVITNMDTISGIKVLKKGSIKGNEPLMTITLQ